jgi:hypothetical protein
MRTLTSVALAGAIAASAFTATATSAAAGGSWYGHHGPPPMYKRYHYGPDAGAVATGAIIGLAFGALAAQAFAPTPYYYAYPPAPFYPAYSPQAAWCSAQFDSYNPATNTWVDFYGVVHVCNGPY